MLRITSANTETLCIHDAITAKHDILTWVSLIEKGRESYSTMANLPNIEGEKLSIFVVCILRLFYIYSKGLISKLELKDFKKLSILKLFYSKRSISKSDLRDLRNTHVCYYKYK